MRLAYCVLACLCPDHTVPYCSVLNIIWDIILARPQLLGGGPGRGVRQAADWLCHATKGVTSLAGVSGAVSTGNTVVRVHMRRTIITSGDGFR